MEGSTLAKEQQALNPRSLLSGPVLVILILLAVAFYPELKSRWGKGIGDNKQKRLPATPEKVLEDLADGNLTFTEVFSDRTARQALVQKLSERSIRVPVSKSGTLEEAANIIFGDKSYYSGSYELPLADWLLADNVRQALVEVDQTGDESDKAVIVEWERFRDACLDLKRLLDTPLQQVLPFQRQTISSGLTEGTVTGNNLLGMAILLRRHAAAVETLHQWRKQSIEVLTKLPDEVAAAVVSELIIDYVDHESDADRASNKAGRKIRNGARPGENVARVPTDLRWGHPVRICDIDPSTLKVDLNTTFTAKQIPGKGNVRDPLCGKVAKGRKVLMRYESMPLATHEATMTQLRDIEDRLHACIVALDPAFRPILEDLKTWPPKETLERTIQGAQ